MPMLVGKYVDRNYLAAMLSPRVGRCYTRGESEDSMYVGEKACKL